MFFALVIGLTSHDCRNSRTSIDPHCSIKTYPFGRVGLELLHDNAVFLLCLRSGGFRMLGEECRYSAFNGYAF